jgi:hypothetical protein
MNHQLVTLRRIESIQRSNKRHVKKLSCCEEREITYEYEISFRNRSQREREICDA